MIRVNDCTDEVYASTPLMAGTWRLTLRIESSDYLRTYTALIEAPLTVGALERTVLNGRFGESVDVYSAVRISA